MKCASCGKNENIILNSLCVDCETLAHKRYALKASEKEVIELKQEISHLEKERDIRISENLICEDCGEEKARFKITISQTKKEMLVCKKCWIRLNDINDMYDSFFD